MVALRVQTAREETAGGLPDVVRHVIGSHFVFHRETRGPNAFDDLAASAVRGPAVWRGWGSSTTWW